MSDGINDTLPSQSQQGMLRSIKELRDDRGATLTSRLDFVKDVSNESGDTSVRRPHPTRCKACNVSRDDKGDKSTS